LPPSCSVRAELGSQLINATQDVDRLLADSETAKPGSEQQTALLDLLQQARTDQGDIQRALSNHTKKHGCDPRRNWNDGQNEIAAQVSPDGNDSLRGS
jgi:hypothetical protein